MCGIYGTTIHYSDEIVRQKLMLMRFRGPDYRSFLRLPIHNQEKLTLGHVRLSIMDLDPRSNQPFCYNERITIVFNGEIYNYQELKSTCLSDVNFRTNGDTEVICAMYEKYGEECVKYLNGMFAYVIYDKEKNILVGARDRLGKKPFYYSLSPQGFEFASQLNPIRYGRKLTISTLARKFYLLNGYISDPLCIYDEVKKLRAGQYFVFDLDTYKMDIHTYWDIFTNSCRFTAPKSYEEAKETLRDLLFDAVKIRLNADVPIGMFLSGGIDSSLTSAIVAKHNKNICAYSIGFQDRKYNESMHAQNVADYLGIPIKINYCEGNDMLHTFEHFTDYYDEPFADNSLIPTSYLAWKTREDVTVAIGGDGGDELFYGYSSYSKLQQKAFIMSLPYAIRKGIYKVVSTIHMDHNIELLRYKDLQATHIARGGYGDLSDAVLFDMVALSEQLPDRHYLYNTKRGLLAFSDYDMKHYMNSCINTKTDRASMRASLELRSPIMDYRVAEYSRMLPYKYLMNHGKGKRILRDILYDMVPSSIMERPKQGFAAPVMQWFQRDMKDTFMQTLTYQNVQALFPELNAGIVINLRDKMLIADMPIDCGFFKLFSYIQWYKSQQQFPTDFY